MSIIKLYLARIDRLFSQFLAAVERQ